MNARLVDSQATVYAKPDDASPIIATITKGQPIDAHGVAPNSEQDWIPVRLPDGREGFLPGETTIFRSRAKRLVRDTEVHAEPSIASEVRVRYPDGAVVGVIGVIENDGRTWLQIQDGDSEEGYILAENSLADRSRISPADIALQRARRGMLVGGACCAGGAAVTVVNYATASAGGTYVVAWGAIVFGGWRFLKGLAGLKDA